MWRNVQIALLNFNTLKKYWWLGAKMCCISIKNKKWFKYSKFRWLRWLKECFLPKQPKIFGKKIEKIWLIQTCNFASYDFVKKCLNYQFELQTIEEILIIPFKIENNKYDCLKFQCLFLPNNFEILLITEKDNIVTDTIRFSNLLFKCY